MADLQVNYLEIDSTMSEIKWCVEQHFADEYYSISVQGNFFVMEIAPNCLLEVVTFLKNNALTQAINLTDICGVDWLGKAPRFEVVYHFLSPVRNIRFRIKCLAEENQPVPSITSVFKGALWFEREVFDMYGIEIEGHPDLSRILTDYDFEGFPLQKDFPLSGLYQVRYDENDKKVVREPVMLDQGFRHFDTLSPWQGYGDSGGYAKKHVKKNIKEDQK